MMVVLPAWANDDALEISARHELFYDSNLFRSPTNSQRSGGDSDTINTTTLGLRFDKMYSLQRFELDANLVDLRYNRFSYLDFSALNYRGTWHWSATPRVRGTLYADRRTRSNSFTDVSNTSARNLRTDEDLSFDGEADLGAAVRLIGALRQQRQTNEQIVLEDRDSQTRSALAGLRYVYPSGSFVGYGVRLSRGDYLNRVTEPTTLLPTEFHQTEHEVNASWSLTSKTSVIGRLSYLRRTHATAPQRDFSTPLGELRLRWKPTGKVQIDAALGRTVIVTHTEYASYAIGQRISLTPTWNATAHTSVRLQLEHIAQDYNGALTFSTFPIDRQDKTNLARLAMDWKPRDSILLTMQLQAERRSSSFSGFAYRTHGASLAARVRF